MWQINERKVDYYAVNNTKKSKEHVANNVKKGRNVANK